MAGSSQGMKDNKAQIGSINGKSNQPLESIKASNVPKVPIPLGTVGSAVTTHHSAITPSQVAVRMSECYS